MGAEQSAQEDHDERHHGENDHHDKNDSESDRDSEKHEKNHHNNHHHEKEEKGGHHMPELHHKEEKEKSHGIKGFISNHFGKHAPEIHYMQYGDHSYLDEDIQHHIEALRSVYIAPISDDFKLGYPCLFRCLCWPRLKPRTVRLVHSQGVFINDPFFACLLPQCCRVDKNHTRFAGEMGFFRRQTMCTPFHCCFFAEPCGQIVSESPKSCSAPIFGCCCCVHSYYPGLANADEFAKNANAVADSWRKNKAKENLKFTCASGLGNFNQANNNNNNSSSHEGGEQHHENHHQSSESKGHRV